MTKIYEINVKDDNTIIFNIGNRFLGNTKINEKNLENILASLIWEVKAKKMENDSYEAIQLKIKGSSEYESQMNEIRDYIRKDIKKDVEIKLEYLKGK